MSKRPVLGLVEKVTILGEKQKTVVARIDTGATKSSIDSTVARELKLGPIMKKKQVVRSSHGTSIRPIVRAKIIMNGSIHMEEFTLAPRSHMTYPVLIGQNILKKGKVLIDPLKS